MQVKNVKNIFYFNINNICKEAWASTKRDGSKIQAANITILSNDMMTVTVKNFKKKNIYLLTCPLKALRHNCLA